LIKDKRIGLLSHFLSYVIPARRPYFKILVDGGNMYSTRLTDTFLAQCVFIDSPPCTASSEPAVYCDRRE